MTGDDDDDPMTTESGLVVTIQPVDFKVFRVTGDEDDDLFEKFLAGATLVTTTTTTRW